MRSHPRKTKQISGSQGGAARQNLLMQAKAHHQAGRFQQAEALYRQILLADPNHPEALNFLGLLAHQVGRNEIAAQLISKAVSCRPDYVEAHNNLGNVFLAQGSLENAVTSYRQALTLKPDYVDAHYNLGVTYNYHGKLDEAVASFRQALSLKPDLAEAHYNLGTILQAQGKENEAVASYQRALSLEADNIDALYNLGVIFNGQGKLDEAMASYRRALSLKDDFAEAHNNLGIVLQTQGKRDEAVASFRRALALKPDYVEACYNLGVLFSSQGKLNEAAASFRRALTSKPDYAEAHFHLGGVLQAQGKDDEAITSFSQAIALKPDYVEAYINTGIIFSESGKMDKAVVAFRKALSFNPDSVKAYKGLSAIVDFAENDDFIQAMENLYNKKEALSVQDRILLGGLLGKAFEDLRNYDKSFKFILESNHLQRGLYKYSTQDDQMFFERIKKTFSPDFFAAHHRSGNRDRTPVFILGMPRSGTSLVEQILASHPTVFGAGELRVLTNLTTDVCTVGTTAQFPECILDLGMDAFEGMGANYIEKIREYSNDAEYITDKMPHNFLYVGLIKAILPNAKVIHCVRNPMDNCFSIFKKIFEKRHDYAHDLVELGQYYNLYRDLMSYWEEVIPGFMYTLSYEEMVSDQQNQTKNLLDFCGLPWDEACLTFYKTERKVSTASLAQVRKPIYNDSVERWKRNEGQLEPLKKALYG